MNRTVFLVLLVAAFIGAGCTQSASSAQPTAAVSATAFAQASATVSPKTPSPTTGANVQASVAVQATQTIQATASPNREPSGSWMFFGLGWKYFGGQPPACPEPLVLQSPVDLKLATSLLYPGQVRGGDYKAHGGFRMDGATNVNVRAPLDGVVTQASRYLERGEVQYMFDFIHPCGIQYRLDHLSVLSPKLAAIAETLPEPKEGDSRTHDVNEVQVEAGEVLATNVGFTNNVFVDLGVYDLRQPNAASQDQAWASEHTYPMARHAVCWLDLLSPADEATVRALPAADGKSGSQSDYCT